MGKAKSFSVQEKPREREAKKHIWRAISGWGLQNSGGQEIMSQMKFREASDWLGLPSIVSSESSTAPGIYGLKKYLLNKLTEENCSWGQDLKSFEYQVGCELHFMRDRKPAEDCKKNSHVTECVEIFP